MCEALQTLEEDRIQFVRNAVWNFTNIGSEICVKIDDSRENIRSVAEYVDYNSDIRTFVQQNTTCIAPLPSVLYQPYGGKAEMPLPETPSAPSQNGTIESQYSFADKKRNHPTFAVDGEYAEITEADFPATNPNGSRRSSNASRTSVGSKVYYALYDYSANSPDEISLKEGDHLEVSSTSTNDPGWIEGHNKRTNKTGLFPANYVKESGM